MGRLAGVGLGLCLTACAAKPPPSPKVVYRDVLKEVPRPCPVKRFAKPAPLARPLPTDLGALVDLLLAKLADWAGGEIRRPDRRRDRGVPGAVADSLSFILD